MGNFTLTLKEVLDFQDDIGLNDYPIFDARYRESLNQKIIDHFWNREIGQETVSMFTHALKRKMNEIMPRYNAIYRVQAQAIDMNALVTFQTSNTGENTSESSSTNSDRQNASQKSDSEAKARAVNNTFPQQQIESDGQYATEANDSESNSVATGESDSTSSGESKGQSSGTMVQRSEGFTGVTIPGLIASVAEAFINTDLEIIDELEGLFMLIWDSGDAFTDNQYGWGMRGGFV